MKRSGATVRDVARAAGVSTATVSRALNDDGRVSEEARSRVREAAEKLSYRANHVARSLKTRSTRTVAILAPELSNNFFMELAEGMERELAKSGYMLLISSSSNSAAEEERRLRVLADRLVDGIVVIPAASRGEHLQAAADRGTPVVLVDRLVEGASLDAVLADNEGGACGAVWALLADGFRRVAFVGGDIIAPGGGFLCLHAGPLPQKRRPPKGLPPLRPGPGRLRYRRRVGDPGVGNLGRSQKAGCPDLCGAYGLRLHLRRLQHRHSRAGGNLGRPGHGDRG